MKTGEQTLNLPFPAPASICNDITLAKDGSAYISDTPNGQRKVEFVRSPELKDKDPGRFKVLPLPLPSS